MSYMDLEGLPFSFLQIPILPSPFDVGIRVHGLRGIGPPAYFDAPTLGEDVPFGRVLWLRSLASFLVEAVRSRTDLGKGQTMFEGLASRFERNQLLDELYGDLDSVCSLSTNRLNDLLDGFAFEADAPSENASPSDQEAA